MSGSFSLNPLDWFSSNPADAWGGSGVGQVQAQGLGSISPTSIADIGRGTSMGSSIPGMGGSPAFATGLGMNVGTGQLALGGLGALGNLWSGFQAQNLAQKQFDFTKRTTDTNLRNQTQAYNNTLDDRINSRAKVQGMSQSEVDDYLARNRLSAR